MYRVKLTEVSSTDFVPTVTSTLTDSETAPPVLANFGS
jgi:hypothetical protein